MNKAFKALYVHIPFCKSKCAYCDFDSIAISENDAKIDAHIELLVRQIRRASKAGLLAEVKTIYIGGGTPTHIGAKNLTSLLYAISVSIRLENVEEYTLEVNPESFDEAICRDVFQLGVNRLSIGVQSFDDATLEFLGRPHTAKQAKAAIEIATERFDNVSIDLICGIPTSGDADARVATFSDSLETAIDYKLKHLSVYPLSIEENTALSQSIVDGSVNTPDEEEQVLQMLLAQELLGEAGLSRYEISNYAKPAYESKHNTAYWTNAPYLGIGSGAASMFYIDDLRAVFEAGIFEEDAEVAYDKGSADPYRIRMKHSALANSKETSTIFMELLTLEESELEDLVLGLRLTQGVPLVSIESIREHFPKLNEVIDSLLEYGMAVIDGDYLKTTQNGWLFNNLVSGAIWDLASV